jgi:membrane protease YdiL (CAAX protease family)
LLATEYIINLFGFDIKKEDVVSLIWMGVVAIIALYIFLGENISFKKAGLTFKNWPRDLIEGTAVGTAIVTVGFLIFSWIEHYTIQEYFFKVVPKLEWTRWVFLYILHSFLQEFIVRLGFQYPIRFFLNDKKGYLSLLVVSMNTAALHIAWDWVFIISTFFGNLLIGYVYLKRNSVFETTIIHFIAGYFAVIHSKM